MKARLKTRESTYHHTSKRADLVVWAVGLSKKEICVKDEEKFMAL